MKKSDHDLPLDGEVNPNHPVTQFARDQWHKIVALLMQETGKEEFEITPAILEKMFKEPKVVVMDARNNRLIVRMVSQAEGERLAQQEGGLPV